MADDVGGVRGLLAETAALMLWQLQAIKVATDDPFKLTSGNYSPIYINCRAVISDPAVMDFAAAAFHWICRSEHIEADVLAGGETAGIPFAAFLAHRLCKPMAYVRKRPKGHGTRSLVEGGPVSGLKALLVEDLVTDGKSKLDFVAGLRDAGASVSHCVVLFDREQGGELTLADVQVKLHSVTTMRLTLNAAAAHSLVAATCLSDVDTYLASPKEWHSRRGLPFVGEGDG